MWRMDDSWYLPGDTTLEAKSLAERKENNLQVLQKCSLTLPMYFISFKIFTHFVILLTLGGFEFVTKINANFPPRVELSKRELFYKY